MTKRQHDADVPNLGGTWRLEKETSESLSPYLEAMGLCQIAIDGHQQKESTTETYYTFEQTSTSLTIIKESWSGVHKRELVFGKAYHEPGQIGKKVTAFLTSDAVVVSTEMKGKTLVDSKSIEDGKVRIHLKVMVPDQTSIDIVRWLVPSLGGAITREEDSREVCDDSLVDDIVARGESDAPL